MGRLVSLLLLPVVLMGCQHLPDWASVGTDASGQPTAGELLPRDHDLLTLVNYMDWLGRQGRPVLEKAHREAQQRVTGSANPADRLNLAMLLSVPDSGFQDDAQALLLFDQVLEQLPANARELRGFVRLQQTTLRQRRALSRFWQGQLEEQNQQAEMLRRQLEQLKSIEKGLIERREE